MSATFPITGLPVKGVSPNVLVVGDPARAAKVAERLENSSPVAKNREYHSFAGSWNGSDVLVISHGVGTAGAAACFSEIIKSGATRIVRAGTCGGLQETVTDGDLVIATAAVRDDGYSRGVVPIEFPAVAHPNVTAALMSAADRAHLGIVLTSDVFYPSEVLGSNLPLWQRAGCMAVEMECAALFVAASLAGIEAGALLTVDGNPLVAGDAGMDGYDPHRSVVTEAVDEMIASALAALVAAG